MENGSQLDFAEIKMYVWYVITHTFLIKSVNKHNLLKAII